MKLVALDGTLLHMNSAGLGMIGADRAETVVGTSVYELIAPRDRGRFRAFNERICRGERGTLEFDIVGLHGANRHMETHAAPLRMSDGKIVQLAVARDITERTRTEKELRKSEERHRALAEGLESQVRVRTKELESEIQKCCNNPDNFVTSQIVCSKRRMKKEDALPVNCTMVWGNCSPH